MTKFSASRPGARGVLHRGLKSLRRVHLFLRDFLPIDFVGSHYKAFYRNYGEPAQIMVLEVEGIP